MMKLKKECIFKKERRRRERERNTHMASLSKFDPSRGMNLRTGTLTPSANEFFSNVKIIQCFRMCD